MRSQPCSDSADSSIQSLTQHESGYTAVVHKPSSTAEMMRPMVMQLQKTRSLFVSVALLPHLVGCFSLGNPKPSPYALEAVSSASAGQEVSWKQAPPEHHSSCSVVVLAPPPQLALDHAKAFEVSAKMECANPEEAGTSPRVTARLDANPPLSFSVASGESVQMTLEDLGSPGAGSHRLAVFVGDESGRVLRGADGAPLGTLVVFEVTASDRGEVSR